jgi:hypothetical protein
MDKRTPITTPPYQVPSVDVTPDPPIFSLVTTFKTCQQKSIIIFGPFSAKLVFMLVKSDLPFFSHLKVDKTTQSFVPISYQ